MIEISGGWRPGGSSAPRGGDECSRGERVALRAMVLVLVWQACCNDLHSHGS